MRKVAMTGLAVGGVVVAEAVAVADRAARNPVATPIRCTTIGERALRAT
jgi:hypothetical protein